jgi:hypothetical protein
MDVDNIPIRSDFRRAIDDAIQQSSCVLAVIGPGWIRASQAGQTDGGNLHSETDYVRLEVHSALARGKPLIPVLVGSVAMPEPGGLPAEIRDIAFINASAVRSGQGFRTDIEILLRAIRQLHGQPDSAAHAAESDIGPAGGAVVGLPVPFSLRQLIDAPVNLRLKRYQLLALQTVPVEENGPGLAPVVLFDLSFFGRRPGWRFGTV